MSKYTIKGSSALDNKIDSDLQRIAEMAAPFCLAGVLLGGYGRGEGTPFIHPNGSQSPFNDYDLIVVVDTLDHTVRQNFQSTEIQLSQELGLPVDLYPYLLSELPSREFSMLNYEMKYGHKVVWGDKDILATLPNYPHDALPLSEGSRLLMNRGKLLLDIQQRLANPKPLNDAERIRFIKFIFKVRLALGDCALLAAGQYDIAYAVKKKRITDLIEFPDRDAVIAGYLAAIALKEWGDYSALEPFDLPAELEATRALFLRFFPGYRTQAPSRARTLPAWIRERLYTALPKLLQKRATLPIGLFYRLQRRFS